MPTISEYACRCRIEIMEALEQWITDMLAGHLISLGISLQLEVIVPNLFRNTVLFIAYHIRIVY